MRGTRLPCYEPKRNIKVTQAVSQRFVQNQTFYFFRKSLWENRKIMTSLSTKLAQLEIAGKPIQIGIIGAGKFGSML